MGRVCAARIRLQEPSASSLCGDAHGGAAIRNSLQRVGCTSLGPTRRILNVVKNVDADLVVMGSHGRNILSRLIFGSQASKVVNLSEVPVLIVKERKPGTADAARQ